MPALPHVSVCIPVYNGERYLAETIRSVLDQTYRDFELVVLDNASTDATDRIARSFGDARLRVETNPTTIPQPDNWRAAVRLCRAPLIKLLCADDLLHPRCLEYQVGPMEADPGLALVAARRHMVDERSRVLVASPWADRPNRRAVQRGGCAARGAQRHQPDRRARRGAVPPRALLHRRWMAAGTAPRDGPRLWMRLLQCGEFLGLPETLAAFRVAQQSLSVENEAGVYEHQKAIMAELAASRHLHIRRRDSTVGQMLAPTGRLRRRILFGMSKRAARRDATIAHPS